MKIQFRHDDQAELGMTAYVGFTPEWVEDVGKDVWPCITSEVAGVYLAKDVEYIGFDSPWPTWRATWYRENDERLAPEWLNERLNVMSDVFANKMESGEIDGLGLTDVY